MPHQCTNCGRTFPDGSKEMLSGCPDCGGNKFQFTPDRSDRSSGTGEEPVSASDEGTTTAPTADGSRGSHSSDARPTPTTGSPTRDDPRAAPAEPTDPGESENTAQADARSEVVSPDELPTGSGRAVDSDASPDRRTSSDCGTSSDCSVSPDRSVSSDCGTSSDRRTSSDRSVSPDRDTSSDRGRAVGEPSSDDRPSLAELREELNEQFESIRIVRPGKYELNLMGLYDREEYIVSLQEDGRYVIDVPESWRSADG